jgi:hypothetical protein
MGTLSVIGRALAKTLADRGLEILQCVLLPNLTRNIPAPPVKSRSPWITEEFWSAKTIDGAVLFGSSPRSGAKYAIPKGLPKAGQKSLAIENEEHDVDGFSGVIASGYGKGVKTLLADETVVLKVKGKSMLTRMNYHVHDADVAGLHYDLVIEDLPPNTEQFEINIPRGEFKGRYAFVTTEKGMIVVPMKDRSIVLPKPDYKLKDVAFLDEVAKCPKDWIIERKVDGSLGNAVIEGDRGYFRSHRETGEAYVDKLPGLEFLSNRSPFALLRALDPGPRLSGTVLKGELVHQDGVSRVSGILNSHPAKAQAMQAKRGDVWFEGWDIVKLRGRDVSHLSAARRRELLEEVIDEISRFNSNWKVVERFEGSDPRSFYESVIRDPRGLPFSEGIVLKRASGVGGDPWIKIKHRDFEDFVVRGILSSPMGTKYANSAAVLIVEDPISGGIGEVGSFAISDSERQWIWDHRDQLIGAVAKVSVMEKTSSGAPRAGVFHAWHGDPRRGGVGTEMALNMYAEALAGGDPSESQAMLYRLKSSAGWRR